MFDAGASYGVELYYKVNQAGKSAYPPRLNGVGTEVVSAYGESSPLGAWGFTLHGTNVTLFGPGGLKQSGRLGPDVLEAFQNSTHVYVGVTPNSTSVGPESVIFSNVSVTAPVPLTIRRTAENFVKCSWPSWAKDYILQVADSLPEAAWTFPQVVVVEEDRKLSVVYPILATPQFFRLMQTPSPE